MVALTQFTVLLGALASLSAAAPAATSTSTPAPTSVSAYGGSTALAMQIFVHHVTDASAGKLCSSDADCKAALQKLDAKRQELAKSTAAQNQNEKRKLSPLSLVGGPWSLAYSLAMSTDEGQKIHGYAVSFLRGICDKDATCKEALAGYDKYVKPVTDKVDQVESDAEDAVLGKVEDVIKDIF